MREGLCKCNCKFPGSDRQKGEGHLFLLSVTHDIIADVWQMGKFTEIVPCSLGAPLLFFYFTIYCFNIFFI